MPDEPATVETAHVRHVTATRELIGRTLGKFTIVEHLAKGGSGDVFRAEQVQLGRSVVVKLLRQEIAWTPNRIERFLREAKLASRLDHPYAAHVYAFGAEPDGMLWIAMEHVKGTTLDELIARRGAMPTRVFAPLFVRLCEVVHTAHELGIVHRDLKGSNVMVIERAGQLLPKLLDFGIAKGEQGDTTPGLDDPVALTGHGVTLGSPQYMSPEQWQRPSEVDGRTDVYALGVLAYRCVCGHLPFQTLDRRALANAHIHEPPPPLPELVPAPICDAIYRALAKEADARWQTAVELGEAIRVAANTVAPEVVPIFDASTREAWLRAGPQPIADAIAQLVRASTTVEADAALSDLVAITCRWLAVLALAAVPEAERAAGADPMLRQRAREVAGRDDAAPWLALARAATTAAATPLPGLVAALAGSDSLVALADRHDDRMRVRTAAALAADLAAAAESLGRLEPLLAYQLVVGRGDGGAESWQGPRRREREHVVVWGVAEGVEARPLGEGEVALLDGGNRIVARLSPLAQVIAPLPSAEPELFLLWRTRRGTARLVAAPWGFERDDDAVASRLAALTTEDSSTEHDVDDAHPPYPGLAAYRVDDANRFVGREREIEALSNRLVRAPMIAVLGPSGVGKSSFLHAGLVPRLREQHQIIALRPGRRPMHALALALGVHDATAVPGKLQELGEQAPRGVVVAVDQLEEIATLCDQVDERAAFASVLARAANDRRTALRVVATLRDDFAAVIENESAFRGRFEVFVLGTPTPDALRRIITEPARRANVSIDPRVVDDMVAEVAGRPASLPLLSFTAAQLWRTRNRETRTIAYDTYVAIGGVAGALASYADEVYATLPGHEREMVRDLFARLDASDGTRVPWPRGELDQLPTAGNVLAHLVDARLLVVRDDDGTDVIEIVHECLAERWPRLARWRSEDAADRALLADVRVAARRWHDSERPRDVLWRGESLEQLRKLATRSNALTDVERAFAEAALHAQRRARRIRRGVIAAAMIALASIAGVMAYLGAIANGNRAAAERNAKTARDAAQLAEQRLTDTLIAQGRRELNDGRALQALAYFAEGLRRGADGPGLRMMIAIASRAWRDTLAKPRVDVTGVPGGSPAGWIAAGDRAGHVHWWSDTGKPIAELATDLGTIGVVRRLPDDSVLLLGSSGAARVDQQHAITARINLRSGAWFALDGPKRDEITAVYERSVEIYGLDGVLRRSTKLPTPPSALDPIVDPSGRFLTVGGGGLVSQIDLVTMEIRPIARDAFGPAIGATSGTIFAYLDRNRTIHVIDDNGTPLRVARPTTRPETLALSATGDRIAAASEHDVAIFDGNGKALSTYSIESDLQLLLVRDDDLWVSGKGGVVRHYARGRLVASLPLVVTAINAGVLARNAVAIVGGDAAIAIVRADATQLRFDAPPCEDVKTFTADGVDMLYDCGERIRVFDGRRAIAQIPPVGDLVFVTTDTASGRTAVSTRAALTVFDRDGKSIASGGKLFGPLAFDGADHVMIADRSGTLTSWAIASGDARAIGAVHDATAMTSLGAGKLLVGTNGGDAIVYVEGRETRRVNLGDRVDFLVRSQDGRWIVAQLDRGAVALLDAATVELVRTLEAGDAFGAATSFDANGDLLLRVSRGAVTISDRATGGELVFGLDLLQDVTNGRFAPDGRIELDGMTTFLLDIPREVRPVEQILADITCHVPLRVVGSQLEPAAVRCP